MPKFTKIIVMLWLVIVFSLASVALLSQNSATPPASLDTHVDGNLPSDVFVGGSFVSPEAFTDSHSPIPPAITGKPVTMTKQSRAVFHSFDGASTVTVDTDKVVRDSRGRVRLDVVREMNGKRMVPYAVITDPVKHEYCFIDSNRRLVTVIHPPNAVSTRRPLDAIQAQVEGKQVLPSKSILGIESDGTRIVTTTKMVTTKDGKLVDIQLTVDSWRSRELDVELESHWTYAGMGEITMKTIQVDQNEPDASLFELPKGYTIVDEGRNSLR
jgi:hypothetical protein